MSRFPGNIIKLPNVTPTQSSAQGVWSLKDQLVYQRNNQWPFQRDPYFNYTTLLLQGNVPNTTGPQAMTQPLAYNSDASTNNFLVTPNGDVSPRPFSPYGGANYSNYFASSTSNLVFASDASFAIGTGNFTVELFANFDAWTGNQTLFYQGTSVTAGITLDKPSSGNTLRFSDPGATIISYSWTPNVGQWYHIAVVRSGTGTNQTTLYIDGVAVAKGTSTASLPANTIMIGGVNYVSPYNIQGYLSNVRYSNVARTISVPTTPYQSDANTLLLTCQSNRFLDATGKTLSSVNGTTKVTDNSPFVSTDFTTGAGYFDGAGTGTAAEYLSIASSSAYRIESNTTWTWECFVYPTSLSSNVLSSNTTNASSTGHSIYLASGLLRIIQFGNSNFASTATVKVNEWSHLAIVCNANAITFYLNGTASGTATWGAGSAGGALYIGSGYTGSDLFAGYMCNIRYVVGTAIVPPAGGPVAPLQPVTNTQLLTLQTRAASQNIGFIDSSPNEFIVTKNGNTTQGTFSPFSPTGWGNYFDGSDDSLTGPSGSPLQLGTGDFSIEAFVNGPTQKPYAGVLGGASTPSGWTLRLDNTGTLKLTNGTTSYSATSTVSTNTWVHIAVTRQGTTLRFFINGTQYGSPTSSDSIDLTGGGFQIAKGFSVDGSNGCFTGYISNVRIIKSQAIYTGNFTPPDAALTISSVGTTGTNVASSITGTVSLLTCQSNRFRDASSNNFTITPNNGPLVQAFSPFAPATQSSPLVTGGSGYFDGTAPADYLTWTGTAAGSGAFCYEFWIYSLNGFSTFKAPLGVVATSGYNSALDIRMTSTTINVSQYNVANNNFTVPALQANTWYHVVACRNASNQTTVFLNGERSSTGAATISTNFSGLTSAIGRLDPSNGGDVTGYIAGVRLIVGSTPYDPTQTNIVVPTAPPTAIPNTSLLLNFTGGGIVDATGKNNLETVANAQVSTVQAKWGPGSIYLSGDGNHLISRSSPVFSLNGDFTMEAWVYPINAGRSADAEKYGTIMSCAAVGVPNPEFSWFIRIVGGVITEYFLNLNFTTVLQVTGLSVSINAWHYFAVTRSGTSAGNLKLYIDGSLVGSSSGAVTQTATFTSAQTLMVGRNAGSTAYQNWLSGYVQGVRITPGYVRNVTSSPTGPFPIG
jgi:hypothetical protein